MRAICRTFIDQNVAANIVVHAPLTFLTLPTEKLEDSGFHGSESPFHLLLLRNVHRPAQGWLLNRPVSRTCVLELVLHQGKIIGFALVQGEVFRLALAQGEILGLLLVLGKVLRLVLVQGNVLELALVLGEVIGLLLVLGKVLRLVLVQGNVLELALVPGEAITHPSGRSF